MPRGHIIELEDCSELGLILQGRPPAIVHGTTMLLMLLLTLTTIWLACTEADVVVRAAGRVRPVVDPITIYTPADMQGLGAVAEILVKEGDGVRAGGILLRLDTSLVDNQIAKLRQTVEAARQELSGIERLTRLLDEQRSTAQARTAALFDQALSQLTTAGDRQQSDIRAAESKLASLDERRKRTDQLVRSKAASQQQLDEIRALHQQATEELTKARLPIDTGVVEVIRQELALLHRDYDVKAAELSRQRLAHQREIETGAKELANLEIKRESAVLRTPIDGIVITGRINERDVLAPGKAVFEVAPKGGFRFEAAVPGADVGLLQCGMPVKVRFYAYDYQRYGVASGTVSFVSPDSQMVTADGGQAGSDVAFVVQTVLDQTHVQRASLIGEIKLGMSGMAEVVIGRESLLTILLHTIRHTVSLS